jgi:RNA polymerase sigma factor (sigma-70 family)
MPSDQPKPARAEAPPASDPSAHRLSAEAELLAGVGRGEWAAWDEIINRYGRLVTHTAARTGLSYSDAADVAQTTWLRLWKHSHQIREPERLAAWLISTARREAIRLATSSRKYVLYADPADEHLFASSTAVHDAYEVEQGYSCVVEEAMDRLPPQYRTLLRMLSSELSPSYSEVADRLGLPIGSIGPMRMRAIRMLKTTPDFIGGSFPRPGIPAVA